MNSVVEAITYFAEEGRVNLTECLRLSFETARKYSLDKLVIFTGIGDGVQEALQDFHSKPEYSEIRIIGVTFPQGFEIRDGDEAKLHKFSPERKDSFLRQGVSVVRAHLPFNSISAQYQHTGVLAQDLGIVGNALNILCGSMSLCIQATLMACDAGEVDLGEHIVVMTSDTSLIVRSAPTSRLLTDFVVRQIICKPAFLTIAKGEKVDILEAPADTTSELPSPTDVFGLQSGND